MLATPEFAERFDADGNLLASTLQAPPCLLARRFAFNLAAPQPVSNQEKMMLQVIENINTVLSHKGHKGRSQRVLSLRSSLAIPLSKV